MRLADYADAVKRSVTARQVAELLGLEVDSHGFCKCPLHGEKTSSMKIYPGSRGWYCFGCHQGGSVIDLVMAYYGLGLKDAIRLLNDEFQLGFPIDGKASAEQEQEAKRRADQREAERKRRERTEKVRHEALMRYFDLSYEIAQMELDKKEYAPKTASEEWHPKFVNALRMLGQKREEAEDLALICFGKEEYNG